MNSIQKSVHSICIRLISQAPVRLYVVLAALMFSACQGSTPFGETDSVLDNEYEPMLSHVEITSPDNSFYLGAHTSTLLVNGDCSGQFVSGGQLTVYLQLAGSSYESMCSNGTFTQQIDVSSLADDSYVLTAEVTGLSSSDIATDQIHITKDSVLPELDQQGIIFPANRTYTVNEPLDITLVFTEPVIFGSIERPGLRLEIGNFGSTPTLATAHFSSASGNRITFRYTVQEADTDDDGIRLVSVDVTDVVLTDLAGNRALGHWGTEHLLPSGIANVRIDTERPYISDVTALARIEYSVGEDIFLQAKFSKELLVSISSQSSGPRLFLKIGTVENRIANYYENRGTTMLFRYSVVEGDYDDDGIDVITFDPNLTFLADSTGNALSTTLPSGGIVNLSDVKVDGTFPQITDLSIDKLEAKNGDTVHFIVTFSEQTTIVGIPELRFTLEHGAIRNSRVARYDGNPGVAVGDGSYRYRFSYTLQQGEISSLVKTGAQLIHNTNGSSMSDGQNNAVLTFNEQMFRVNYDAKPPLLVAITPPNNGYYHQGDALVFHVQFDETIVSDATDDTYLELIIGTTNAHALLDPDSLNTSSLVYSYTIEQGLVDLDGITIGNLQTTSSTESLTDAVGNQIDFVIPTHVRPDMKQIVVDDIAPKIDRLSRPTAGTYSLRDGFNMLQFVFTFDEDVTYQDNALTSSIVLPLVIGDVTVDARYSGVTGEFFRTHQFVYILEENLLDTDGIAFEKLWFNQSGTTDRFIDRAGNQVSPLAPVSENLEMPLVFVDSTVPQLRSLEFYNTGDIASTLVNTNLQLGLIFDKTVDVHPTARIPFRIGTNSFGTDVSVDYFVYTDNTGDAKRKVFSYHIRHGQNDNDGLLLGANDSDIRVEFVDGGYIRDQHANRFDGNLNGLAQNLLQVRVDTSNPYIERISVSSALQHYIANDTIELLVTFNEDIRFIDDGSDATVRLPLQINGTTYYADFDHFGTNNQSLIFVFTVPPGLIADNIDIQASSLDASTTRDTLTDLANNQASLRISDSVSIALDGISIDSTVPVITTVSARPGYYTSGDTIDLYIDFNKNVTVSSTQAEIDFRIEDFSNAHVRSFSFVRAINNTRLHFRYQVTAGEDADGIVFGRSVGTSGTIQLATSESITGISGEPANLEIPVASLPDVIIDTTAPYIEAFMYPAKRSYTSGEHIDIYARFSEDVSYNEGLYITDSNLGIAFRVDTHNRYARYNDHSQDKRTFKFTYKVQTNEQDNNISLFNFNPLDSVNAQLGDFFADQAGNRLQTSFSDTITGDPISIDSAGPRVTNVILPFNSLYQYNDTMNLRVEFNENIIVHGTDFRIPFRLEGSSGVDLVRYFDLSVDAIGTNSLLFTYRIAHNDQDLDGILLGSSLNAIPAIIAGNNARIVDDNGLESDYDLRVDTNQVDVSIDARSPQLIAVSGPGAGSYGLDDALSFTLTFSEPVSYFGSPTMTSSGFFITIDDTTHDLIYNDAASIQPNQLVFYYSIPLGVSSSGIDIAYQMPVITPGRIIDMANHDASIDLDSLVPRLNLNAVSIDSLAPRVASVSLADSDPSTTRVLFGEQVVLTLTFDEQVVVTGDDLAVLLRVGNNDDSTETERRLRLDNTTDTTLVFTYSPMLGEFDIIDGVRLVLNSQGQGTIQLHGGSIKDRSGNNARLVFTAPTENIKIDTDQTAIKNITLPAPGWYSDTLDFIVQFSDAVSLDNSSALLNLVLELEPGERRRAIQVTELSSDTYSLRYSLERDDYDNNGLTLISPLQIDPVSANLTDSRNAQVNRTFNPSSYDMSQVFLGRVTPDVTGIDASFASDTAGKVYNSSTETLSITLTYNVPVTVTGAPRIPFLLGSETRFFTYDHSSDQTGDRHVVFIYQINAGDEDLDRIDLNNRSLDLNGGTVTGFNGTDAVNDFSAASGLTSVLANLPRIDTKPPVIDAVRVAPAEYTTGETITFNVDFSETVILQGLGTLQLTINIGTKTKQLNATGGSGTSTIRFEYTVIGSDQDIDGISIQKLQLIDATLKDAQGNNAGLALNGVTTRLSTVTVNTATATQVINIGADTGIYSYGEAIDIRVTYSNTITVDTTGGTPQLELTLGSSTRTASYISGSGSTILVFRHTVISGDSDTDGIQITSIDPDGASLRDPSGNEPDNTIGTYGQLGNVVIYLPNTPQLTLASNLTYGDTVPLSSFAACSNGDNPARYTTNDSELILHSSTGNLSVDAVGDGSATVTIICPQNTASGNERAEASADHRFTLVKANLGMAFNQSQLDIAYNSTTTAGLTVRLTGLVNGDTSTDFSNSVRYTISKPIATIDMHTGTVTPDGLITSIGTTADIEASLTGLDNYQDASASYLLRLIDSSSLGDAAAAYSLRRVLTNYSGPAIMVRRNTDDATTDVGFTIQGNLDTIALTQFVQGYDAPEFTTDISLPDSIYALRKVNPRYTGAAIRVIGDSETDIGFDASGDLDITQLPDAKEIPQTDFNTNLLRNSGLTVTVTQSTTHTTTNANNDNYSATQAIDGITTDSTQSRALTSSSPHGHSWLYIQLDSIQPVNLVKYYVNTVSDESRSYNVYIILSENDPGLTAGSDISTDDLNTLLVRDDVVYQELGPRSGSGNSPEIHYFTGSPRARFITIIKKNVNAQLQLAEIEAGYANVRLHDIRVKTWYDQSGNSNDATQTDPMKQPVFRDASGDISTLSNGTYAMTFTGSQSLTFDATLLVNTDYSLFAAIDTSGDQDGTILSTSESANTSGMALRLLSANTVALSYNGLNNSTEINSIPMRAFTGPEIVTAIRGTGQTLLRYGDYATTGSTAVQSNTTGRIGVGYGDYFTGAISEILIYDSDQSTNHKHIEGNMRSALNLINLHLGTWYDQSGNNIHMVQDTANNQPKIVTHSTVVTENGLPAVDFDAGRRDVLASQVSLTSPTTELTITLVHRKTTSSTEGLIFNINYSDTTSPVRAYLPYSNGKLYWDAGDATLNRLETSAMSYNDTTQTHQYTLIKSTLDNNQAIRRDASNLATKNPAIADTDISTVALGGKVDMRVQEYIIHLINRTTDQITAIENDQQGYWLP